MDVRKLFKKYYARLVAQAFLRALIYGLLIGFSANLLLMTFSLLFMLRLFWVGFVVLGVVTAVVTALLFIKFRPDEKDVARRMDKLGLLERVITMHELKGQDTDIARLQRADTMKTVENFNAGMLTFALSLPMIIVFAVVALSGVSISTVTTLTAAGVIENPNGDGGGGILPVPTDEEQVKFYTVTYEFQGKGMIQGEVFQVIEEGENAEPVLAVPDDESGFFVWLEDGSEEPYRQEFKVVEDMTFTAVFRPGQPGDPSPDGDPTDGDEGEESDDAADKPDDDGNEGDQNQPQPDPSDPSGGPGGQYEPHNQVIDGETFYGGAVFENANEEMIERIIASGEYTPEEEEMIKDYFKTIKK